MACYELGLSTASISKMKVTATRGCGVQRESQQRNARSSKTGKTEKDVETQAGGEGREAGPG